MNRREFLVQGAGAAAVSLAVGNSLRAQGTPSATGEELIYVSAKSGADSNAGTKEAPFKPSTRRPSASTGYLARGGRR